jgi:hypothetical protein
MELHQLLVFHSVCLWALRQLMAGSHHVGLDISPQHSLLVPSVSTTVDTCNEAFPFVRNGQTGVFIGL